MPQNAISNPGFNRAFDDFASSFAIKDASDEDQCRDAREEMGFEPEHPFDTDVCQKFHENLCDPFFTGVDHMTQSLSEPPKFEQTEYEDVESEEVEYDEVEYSEVDYKAVGYETVGYSAAADYKGATYESVENDFVE